MSSELGAQVDRDADGLQEHLGQHHGAADVDPHAAVQAVDEAAHVAEVEHGRFADLGAVRLGMHVDDVGAEAHVHRAVEAEPRALGADAQVLVGRLSLEQHATEPAAEAAHLPGGGLQPRVAASARPLRGLGREAEVAFRQLRGDVLARHAGGRDLESRGSRPRRSSRRSRSRRASSSRSRAARARP
jgi:hypothetical protein